MFQCLVNENVFRNDVLPYRRMAGSEFCLNNFFYKFLKDINPFCGATSTSGVTPADLLMANIVEYWIRFE